MKTKHKILAFVDITKPIETLVESTVNLATTYNAAVKFFYVKKPSDPTRTVNQLEIVRAMAAHQKASEKLRNVLNRTRKQTDLPIYYDIVEGPVKKTITAEIQSFGPDMIVLGKRKPSVFRWLGNQVTELVLKNFDGPLLIAHPSKALRIEEQLSLGIINDVQGVIDHELTNRLLMHTKTPVKSFQIAGSESQMEQEAIGATPMIKFRFEDNPNALKSLTSYIHRNDVHLVCLNRNRKKKKKKNVTLRDVLKNINTSMLMVGSTDTKNLINA